jgi:hypothetical protein
MNNDDVSMLESQIKQTLRRTKSNSSTRLNVVADAKCIIASINIITKYINIDVPYDWNPNQFPRVNNFARLSKNYDLRIPETTDVTIHEVGHDKLQNDINGLGCPQDMEHKEIAIDATIKGMLENHKFSQDGASYLENTISDIINNINGSQYTKFDGLTAYLGEQGELNGGKHSPLFEVFTKLNMEMWGNNMQKIFLKKYFTNDTKIDDAIKSCIKDLQLGVNKNDNIKILFNKDNWNETFYIFSKHLSKLMDTPAPEILFGGGSSGKGYKVPAKFDDSGTINPETVTDTILKKVLDNDNLKKSLVKRNSQGKPIPTFIDNWRALDLLYQGLASEIYIKAETIHKGESIPIAPIQSRMFDQDKDNLEKIIFGKILIDDNGKPALAVPRTYLEQAVKYKKSINSCPELNITLLDLSASMLESADSTGNTGHKHIIPWGDNSKYHYAALVYYCVEKALHRIGVGVRTKYNVITFAEDTKTTGTVEYYNDVRKQRILQPIFGDSTNIDMAVLSKECHEPESILMTISDGAIHNWSGIKNQFKNLIKDKFYVHFQIGAETAATKDLKSWGVTVIPIANAQDLPRRAIDVVKTFYKNYAAGDYHG